MKNSNSLLLLLVSLLLVIVSGVLLWTWGYRVYNKNENATVQAPVRDSAAIARAVKDSLQKQYDATIQELNTQVDSTLYGSDSLRGQLSAKLEEFFRLKDEINNLLKDKSTTFNQNLARQKIVELQIKVQELRNRNSDVEQENKKLNALLEQLRNLEKNNPGQDNAKRTLTDARPENSFTAASVFTASDLRLSAMTVDNDKEIETTSAQQTEKLVGSFVVKNPGAVNNTEIMVVVVQPDGRVLKGSAWESGMFTTPEGKKIYSYKLSFDYARGEAKRLLFSLSADKYQKGNYIMQVYHNGSLIGKLSKTLS